MAGTYTTSISGEELNLRSWEDLERFLTEEAQVWRPLAVDGDPGGGGSRAYNVINGLTQQAMALRSQGEPFETLAAQLPQYFYPHGDGIATITPLGATILSIADAAGPIAASTAYSFQRQWVRLQALTTIDQVRGVVLLAQPALIDAHELAKHLSNERARLRRAVRDVESEARASAQDRVAIWEKAGAAAQLRIVRFIRERALIWDRQRRRYRSRSEEAIDQLTSTRKAFEELMRLKAPAAYWSEKAGTHRVAEKAARGHLILFFVLAMLGLGAAFGVTGWAILRPGATSTTPVYIVISAGLATFTGVVFWIGRLLTRLYLSEHHLRKDAEEREVMTTTYLALTKESAAADADRQIILNALFRNSADGIVKDDGGFDPSLAAAIARIGMGGRTP